MWAVTIYGQPATKGSLKCVGRGGRHQLIEDDKPGTRRVWRARVAHAAAAILSHTGRPFSGPVGVGLEFTISRPKSAPKSRIWPVTRSSGDLDKLARLALDAITDAGLWADDSQCCQLHCTKRYMGAEGALPEPGLRLTIWEIE